jgi:GNAT superfamily N-acetyltransferase
MVATGEEHEEHRPLTSSAKESGLPGFELPVVFREEVHPEDSLNVRRLVASSGFFTAEELQVAVELVEDHLDRGLAGGYHFLFAELDGIPVGYTCFGPIACTKSSYDLYWIVVHNDLRGLGVGRKLLSECLQAIARLGGTRVYVETSSRAQYGPTRSFYRANGFVEEAVLRNFYDLRDHKITFSRTIK